MPAFFFFLIVIIGFSSEAFSQELPTPENMKASYSKGIRTTSGLPGKDYWQNKAQYDIRVEVDPVSWQMKGTEEIVYYNNSPDTLKEIVFKLYPNFYQTGAPRLKSIDSADLHSGMKIDKLGINGKESSENIIKTEYTNMYVRALLPPRQSIRFSISFSYPLNKGSHMRTGVVDRGTAFIAYFFPRIAVYDDIDGWNRYPYLGTAEFYNDFCDFRLSVNLPDRYLAWATGDHVNRKDVFTQRYLDRIIRAEKEDGLLTIIDTNDLDRKYDITKGSPFNTWLFEAKNVTDIAFAFSDQYMWQSSSLVVDSSTGRRTRVDAVFSKKHKDYFHVLSDARKTIEAMSFRFPRWPFPYNHMTVFDGLDQMEYPMMANDNPIADRAESIELTDHEIFHTMFPFYMGTNETKYGWMDEGWATLGEWLISPMIDSSIVDEYGMDRYQAAAGKEFDHPIMTLTADQTGPGFFLNSYPKPALGYLYVMDMLGEEVFFKALHHYISTWNGKHPVPLDFFNCMNAGSGNDLNWFWKRWFYDNGFPDLAIGKVSQKGKNKKVTVVSKGNKPVPVDLVVIFDDGSKVNFHRTIEVWKDKNSTTLAFSSPKRIKEVRLGSTYAADIDKSDNKVILK